jgi:hypothetical protein
MVLEDPPFMVRWGDSGREGLLFPGNDAGVEPIREQHDEFADDIEQQPSRTPPA